MPTYSNLLPVDKRIVFDSNHQIAYHYISFFEDNFEAIGTWKRFDPLLQGKSKSPYRFDEKTWNILNFTKWKVIEQKKNTVQTIEAMNL